MHEWYSGTDTVRAHFIVVRAHFINKKKVVSVVVSGGGGEWWGWAFFC